MPSPRFPSPRHRLKTNFSPSWLVCFLCGCLVGYYWQGNSVDVFMFSSSSLTNNNHHNYNATTLQNNDGWRQIDVFYGTAPTTSQQWFSQAAQDELVIGLLRGKRDGYFVDLAANDALLLSNTYALEQRYGWHGLCIEPNPVYWKNLSYYRSCHTVAAVVGAERMQPVYFRYEAGDHGGIADEGFDNGKRWQRSSELAYTVTLQEIFERYQVPHEIDYLSLDVEGAETFVLQQFPLSQYRIKIITAERLKGDIRVFLKGHGYEFVAKLTRWGESLWVHTSVKDELDWSVLKRLEFPRG
ncbi:hypothetical protein FisN_7Hh318 [Fistulifera solaris]|uniref:Methyltransferase FkbM domain-containing protein n=1 Tax=Fistulifera solaris TaxID=1519565 RepID=A0A1Z5KT34_FISSO|nr:hypothetical protein FisN_7Hh318 [Fistulifera solaris]|eukprot:GAX29088.1 hypothetical protein FisN_7Hh318 [Fistulifera solaris]